jgi:hypothetical protein
MELTDIFEMVHNNEPLHAILNIGSGELEGQYTLSRFIVSSPPHVPGQLPGTEFPTLSNIASTSASNNFKVTMTIQETKSRSAAPTAKPAFIVKFSTLVKDGSKTIPNYGGIEPFVAHQEPPIKGGICSGGLAFFTSGTAAPEINCCFQKGA